MQLQKSKAFAAIYAVTLASLAGCAGMSSQEKGTAIGAGVGAVGGAVLGAALWAPWAAQPWAA